ncbi:MAG: DUF4336 domain-containing protein [Myxococcota bacterium]
MRQSTTFRIITTDLWEAEHHRYEGGMHHRMRMTVVRRASGGLWLHSPVPIDDELADTLAKLGRVEDIVAPNRFHYRFARDAKARYGGARLWAAPGLAEKRPEIAFDDQLSEGAPWKEELPAVSIGGAPAWSEYVFLHAASGSLICTDLLFNVGDEPHAATRVLYWALGVSAKFGTNRVWRWLAKDRLALRESLDRVLSWRIERVVMAHGDVVNLRGPDELASALEPLRK